MKVIFTFLIGCFCVGFIHAQSDIASVEYFFDTDPGIGLATTIDINPDTETIDQNFSISTSGLSVGTHRLFIRAINFDGDVSMYEHKTFRVAPVNDSNTSTIVDAEYFFDSDPGVGSATVIDITDTDDFDEALTISTGSLSVGTHRLFIRTKNAANIWSMYEHKTFRIAPVNDSNTSTIVEAEYFFDLDPGVGSATTIDVTDMDDLDETLAISTSSLSVGTHRLFIRTKNAANIWSMYEHKTFRVAPVNDSNTSTIVEAEYFFDTDPGVGSATALDITDADAFDDDLLIPTGSLSVGIHRLFIRTKNAANDWSLYEHKTFRVASTSIFNTASISEVEFFIDVDPGVGNATVINVSGDALDEDLVIPTSGSLPNGIHYLYIRTKNADDVWSIYERQEFTTDGALGVDDELLSRINIYPNSVSDYLNIRIPNDFSLNEIAIYDLNGKQVFMEKNSVETINVSSFQSGVYLLILKTDKGSISRKIIKK